MQKQIAGGSGIRATLKGHLAYRTIELGRLLAIEEGRGERRNETAPGSTINPATGSGPDRRHRSRFEGLFAQLPQKRIERRHTERLR